MTWRRISVSVVAAAMVAGVTAGTATPAGAQVGDGDDPLVSLDGNTLQDLLDDDGALGDTLWGDDDDDQGGQASENGSWEAEKDLGSVYSLTRRIGAQRAWRRGFTGRGVTVALIDTGVSPVPGLLARNKVLDGPDLSYESQRRGTRYLDGFGHGTHMAGIIAARDRGFDRHDPDPERHAGVAPFARLLSLKVASGDGGADVTQVIAAIDWVVRHRRAYGMNVRVLNLSYGTLSTQSWQVDPLAAAVENAWRKGILVVVSGGNDGTGKPLLMPAIDPHVLAVGAVDHNGTAGTLDDHVATFSNSGTDTRRPDVLAPGKSVVSLRVPGSYVDGRHPAGRVPGDDRIRFFRGSGTSQAAAAVSGAAALLFQAKPRLTPAQAKAILKRTARPLAQVDPAQGRGVINVNAAITLARTASVLPSARAPRARSTGLGPLDASRGGEHVIDPTTGDVLDGQFDALGSPWYPKRWMYRMVRGRSWVDGAWLGRRWAGTTWVDGRLRGFRWRGRSWSELRWRDYAFSTDSWEARSWRGDNWEARSWRARSWRGRSWRDGSTDSTL